MRASYLLASLFAVTFATQAHSQDAVARGEYLAKAADCMPCHTASKDKPFAGGLKLNTPFGALYSPNITPDEETGIGKWTVDQFKKAVHAGIRADGKYLYPVMPFDAFTKISDDDIKALWAYFRTVRPIKQARTENALSFPFNIRYGMLVWRSLYFDEGYFKPDAAKTAVWNRGAYLVEALGHCGDCHTPRNFMGATIASKRLQGAKIDQWYAPDISPKTLTTVNKWGKTQLIAFLRKGAANNSTVLGPMQEVVHDSLSFLTDSDLNAMATYLLDAADDKDPKAADRVATLAPGVLARAAKLYADQCAGCHQANGQGVPGSIPPIAGNPAVVAGQPFNILAAVLAGIPARGDMMAMPAFGGSLSDQDVADLANYVRTSWSNAAPPNATPAMVAAWRPSLALPVYAGDAARRFDCPDVGQAGSATLDPAAIAALSGRMSGRPNAYATLVATYKAQQPDATNTDIVNNLVAAYCPIVAATAASDDGKRMALKRFTLNITSYLASQSVAGTAPDVGIIWATPVGYTLAEHDPAGSTTLTCPANDNTRVPRALVAAATEVGGKPELNFRASDATAQAEAMVKRDPKAKLADVANALILTYCRGVSGLTGPTIAEKQAALERYGENVIETLQHTAELQVHKAATTGQR